MRKALARRNRQGEKGFDSRDNGDIYLFSARDAVPQFSSPSESYRHRLRNVVIQVS